MALKFSSSTHDDVGQKGSSLFCLKAKHSQPNVQDLGELNPTDEVWVPPAGFRPAFLLGALEALAHQGSSAHESCLSARVFPLRTSPCSEACS